jgi:hypothetical protein
MAHDQQAIEQPERDCRHHEEVHRRDPVSMVAKERLPSLRRRAPLRAIYLATLVWPTSMPSLRSSPWILGAPHNRLAMLISRISRRISRDTVGRPQRRRDFQRQYDLKPARCQRITVAGRTIASASYSLGNSRQTPPNISLSIDRNGSLLGLARRSTLICCLSTIISASSVARDRSRSITVPKINLHKFDIERRHRPILDQPPADWIYDRDRGVVEDLLPMVREAAEHTPFPFCRHGQCPGLTIVFRPRRR